ncbi:MFS transporter [Sphingopyxis chilensis]
MPRKALAALLLATFTVSLAYGIALPVLPFLLERRLGPGADVAWHTGLLTGTYTLALFLFAPLWGRVSDHRQRRAIILIGMIGFTVSLLLFAFIDSLVALYLGRFLTGAFSAAVIPVSLALISDWAPDDDWRARRFAWLSIAGVAGFLLGPTIGGGVAQMWSAGMPLSGFPFLFAAVAAAIGSAAVWLAIPAAPPPSAYQAPPQAPRVAPGLVSRLLVLGAIVAGGIGTFEVSLALQAQQRLGLGPAEIGLMFTECSLVMVVAQAVVFNPWFPAHATRSLIVPGFGALALALALMPWMDDRTLLFVAVGLIAASAGILSPILAFWVSLTAGPAQGSKLGRQSAASSLGQAIGSAIGGLLFGLIPIFPDIAFLAAAIAALVGGSLALRVPMLLAALVPPPSKRQRLVR